MFVFLLGRHFRLRGFLLMLGRRLRGFLSRLWSQHIPTAFQGLGKITTGETHWHPSRGVRGQMLQDAIHKIKMQDVLRVLAIVLAIFQGWH
jgi:hypothetical protein